jgi:hypothetical protein
MRQSARFGAAAVLAACVVAPLGAELRVGVAAVEITPPVCEDAVPGIAEGESFDRNRGCFRWVHLAGFSPYVPFVDDNRIAEGVHDPLWSRALAVRDADGVTVVLVATDLPGLGRKHTSVVRRRVEETLGVPASHVIIQSTHSHSAPDASGYWSTMLPGHNEPYTDLVRERIYESIAIAVGTLRPARMRVVTTTHVSCQDPRTGELKREPACRLPDVNNEFDRAGSHYDTFVIQRDQRDPIVRNTRIVAAAFVDPDTSETYATLVNWNNHPDTLGSDNRLVSSDYPHYLREYMERALGGTSVYLVGTLGSQIGGLRGTPVPLRDESGNRVYERDGSGEAARRVPTFVHSGWDHIRSIGFEVAAAAVAALEGAELEDEAVVSFRREPLDLPVDNMIHVLLTWSVWNHGVTDGGAAMRYGGSRCWGPLGCVPSEVALIRIGSLSFLTAPGEVDPAYLLGRERSVADYGEWGSWEFPAMPGFDRTMPGIHHAVIGSANDYLSYMIPRSDYVGWWNMNHPNHYEDLVTISKRFGDDVAGAWRVLLEDVSSR